MLGEFLTEQGYDFVHTREPGGTPVSEQVRRVILDPANHMGIIAEALLYAAARAELVAQVIRPALDAGKVVICDRFVDSSLVYQGMAGGLPVEWVAQINEMATGGLKPHRTLLFDLPAEEAMRRKMAQTGATGLDRLEGRDAAYYQAVRDGYLELAQAEPRRIKVLNAAQPVDVLQAEVRRLVLEMLPRR